MDAAIVARNQGIFEAYEQRTKYQMDALFLTNYESWTNHNVDPFFNLVTGLKSKTFIFASAIITPDGKQKLMIPELEEPKLKNSGFGGPYSTFTHATLGDVYEQELDGLSLIGYNRSAVNGEFLKETKERGIIPRFIDKNADRMLTSISQELMMATLHKTTDEISYLRYAGGVAQDIVDSIPSMVYNLMKRDKFVSESTLTAAIDSHMIEKGCQPAFKTILAFGKGSADPHYDPSEKTRLNPGDVILLDFGPERHYMGVDLTRCWSYGEPHPFIEKLYKRVFGIKQESQERMNIGVHTPDVHTYANRAILNFFKRNDFNTRKGEEQAKMGHSTGHNTGFLEHEVVSINKKLRLGIINKPGFTVEEGVFAAVEPAGYITEYPVVMEDRPAYAFGIRLEDSGLVGKNGFESFTGSPLPIMPIIPVIE